MNLNRVHLSRYFLIVLIAPRIVVNIKVANRNSDLLEAALGSSAVNDSHGLIIIGGLLVIVHSQHVDNADSADYDS
ncbi:hypothetical protein SDC9_105745 [bioreactor metagenome]|uniref:Uncharacterized protein n=1 Tax=bioreactor metagenome TaxID=1076179 RepID=A0A645B0D3_9ZZZZ